MLGLAGLDFQRTFATGDQEGLLRKYRPWLCLMLLRMNPALPDDKFNRTGKGECARPGIGNRSDPIVNRLVV